MMNKSKLNLSSLYFILLHIFVLGLIIVSVSAYEYKFTLLMSKGKHFIRSVDCVTHLPIVYKEHICEIMRLNKEKSNRLVIQLDNQSSVRSELSAFKQTEPQSGLSTFFRPSKDKNFIELIFNSENAQAWQFVSDDFRRNPIPFLKTFSTFFVHGDADGRKSIPELIDAMASGQPVSLTCGDIAKLVNHVLGDLKIKSRIVQLTKVSDENGYDDGHIINEIYSPIHEKWIALDMDLKLTFEDSGGTPLSIIEIYNIDWNDISIKQFGHFSVGGVNDDNSFPFYFYSIHMMDNLRAWYKQKFEMIGYRSKTRIITLVDKFVQEQYVLKRKGWISSLNTEDFINRYYGVKN